MYEISRYIVNVAAVMGRPRLGLSLHVRATTKPVGIFCPRGWSFWKALLLSILICISLMLNTTRSSRDKSKRAIVFSPLR